MRTKSTTMTRRTYEAGAENIETADDLDELVHDKLKDGQSTPLKLDVEREDIKNALRTSCSE